MIKNLRSFVFTSFVVAAAGLVLSACTSIANSITPYRIDVLQGNFVSKEQAAALKAGMTQDQVRNILGTPLLSSAFHADRWDYVFSIKPGNKPIERKRLTAYFDKDGKLLRTEGDALPSEEEFVARMDDLRRGVARAGDEPKGELPALAAAAPVPAASAPAAPVAEASPVPTPSAPATTTATPITQIEPAKIAAPAPSTESAATPVATTAPAKEMVASELARIEREVVGVLESWRNAWASKNVTQYLAHYTPEYKGEYTNRSTWEKQRKERLTTPKAIRVDLTDARILITSPDKARVSMQQRYQADGVDEAGSKSLYLAKRNGKWLIENELFFSKPASE
jgi:outer membrane protein assembly factor BamE